MNKNFVILLLIILYCFECTDEGNQMTTDIKAGQDVTIDTDFFCRTKSDCPSWMDCIGGRCVDIEEDAGLDSGFDIGDLKDSGDAVVDVFDNDVLEVRDTVLSDGSAITDGSMTDGDMMTDSGGIEDPCNGFDDDGNGVVDDPNCFLSVRRIYFTKTGDHALLREDELLPIDAIEEDFFHFRLYRDPVPGTVPLYRLFNGLDHMTSIDSKEGASVGYAPEALLGYATTGSGWAAAGYQPASVCRYIGEIDHLDYLNDPWLLSTYGYSQEGCVTAWDVVLDRFIPPICKSNPNIICPMTGHYLPVVTHWQGGTFSYLGTEQVTLYNPNPISDPSAYIQGGCYPNYLLGFPNYESYFCDKYACNTIADSDAQTFLKSACIDTGVPVWLRPPVGWNNAYPTVAEPVTDTCGVQIIHGSIVDGSLVTVFLPPTWRSGAPKGTYPIVINSFYDLNSTVLGDGVHGDALARIVARSGLNGRRGVIGVISNGGGGVASRGMDKRLRRQTAETIAWVANKFGGNPYEVITFGGSRGGFTSLAIASNPEGYDYRTVFAISIAPPTIIGTHLSLLSPTYPGMFLVAQDDTGLADAWRTGWTLPDCGSSPDLVGLTAPKALCKILTGTSDIAQADAEHSLSSPTFIQGLQKAGTQVYLEVTGHDFIVPYFLQVQYGVSLINAFIPMEAHVILRNGHRPRGNTWISVLEAAVQTLTAPDRLPLGPMDPAPSFISPGVHYWTVNPKSGVYTEITPSRFPFTFEGPYRVALGQPYPYVFVGENGTEYALTVRNGATVLQTVTGVLQGGVDIRWNFNAPGPVGGPYRYSLRIHPPGSNGWINIPDNQTPSGDAADIYVIQSEPIQTGYEAFGTYSAPVAPNGGGTNWGLSEF